MNKIGKFEMRSIVNAFDSTLIRLYGLSMLDARISRHDALNAYSEFQCPHKAAEAVGVRQGFTRLNAA